MFISWNYFIETFRQKYFSWFDESYIFGEVQLFIQFDCFIWKIMIFENETQDWKSSMKIKLKQSSEKAPEWEQTTFHLKPLDNFFYLFDLDRWLTDTFPQLFWKQRLLEQVSQLDPFFILKMQHLSNQFQEFDRVLVPDVQNIQYVKLSASKLWKLFFGIQLSFDAQQLGTYYTQAPY